MFDFILLMTWFLHVHVSNTNYFFTKQYPPPPQGKIPPDFWRGMWGGDASVAKFHPATYNCARYAWIVHACDTYRRKIGILCACTVRADFEHVDIVRA